MAETAGFNVVAEDQLENDDADGEQSGAGVFFGDGWRRKGRGWVACQCGRICGSRDKRLRDVGIIAVKGMGIGEEVEVVLGPSGGKPG